MTDPASWLPDQAATDSLNHTLQRLSAKHQAQADADALLELIHVFSKVQAATDAEAERKALIHLASRDTVDLVARSFPSQPESTAILLASAFEHIWRAIIPGMLIELLDPKLDKPNKDFVDGVLKIWQRASRRIISSLENALRVSTSQAASKTGMAHFIRIAAPLAFDLLSAPEKAQALDPGTSDSLINMLNWSGELPVEVLTEMGKVPTPRQLGSILSGTTEVLSATNFFQAAHKFRPPATEARERIDAWDRDFFHFVKDDKVRHRLSKAWDVFDESTRAAGTSELLAALAVAQPERAMRFKYLRVDMDGKPSWLKAHLVRPHPPSHDAWLTREEICIDLLNPELSQGSQSQSADSIELRLHRDDIASLEVDKDETALVITLRRPMMVEKHYKIDKALRLFAVEEDLDACIEQLKDMGWRMGPVPVTAAGERKQKEPSRAGGAAAVLPKDLVAQLSDQPPLPRSEQRASIAQPIELDAAAAAEPVPATTADMPDFEEPPDDRPASSDLTDPDAVGEEDELDMLSGSKKPSSRAPSDEEVEDVTQSEQGPSKAFRLALPSQVTASVTTASRPSSSKTERAKAVEGEDEDLTDPSSGERRSRSRFPETTGEETPDIPSDNSATDTSEHEPSGPDVAKPHKSPHKAYQSQAARSQRRRVAESRKPGPASKGSITKTKAGNMQGKKGAKQIRGGRPAASKSMQTPKKGGKRDAPPRPRDSDASTVEEEDQPSSSETDRVLGEADEDLEGPDDFDDDVPPGGKPPTSRRKRKGKELVMKTPAKASTRPRPTATSGRGGKTRERQRGNSPTSSPKSKSTKKPRRSTRLTAADDDEQLDKGREDERPLTPSRKGKEESPKQQDTGKGSDTAYMHEDEPDQQPPAPRSELESERPLPLKSHPGKKAIADWMSPANKRAIKNRTRESFEGIDEVVEERLRTEREKEEASAPSGGVGPGEEEGGHEVKAQDMAAHYDAPDMGPIDLTAAEHDTDSDTDMEESRPDAASGTAGSRLEDDDDTLRSGTSPVEGHEMGVREDSPASPAQLAGERRSQSQRDQGIFQELRRPDAPRHVPETIDPRILEAPTVQRPISPTRPAPGLLSSPPPSTTSSVPPPAGSAKRKAVDDTQMEVSPAPPRVSQMPQKRRELPAGPGRPRSAHIQRQGSPVPPTPGPRKPAPHTTPAVRVATATSPRQKQPATTPVRPEKRPVAQQRPFQTTTNRRYAQVAVATSRPASQGRRSPSPRPWISTEIRGAREDQWYVTNEEERRAIRQLRATKQVQQQHVGDDSGVAGMTTEEVEIPEKRQEVQAQVVPDIEEPQMQQTRPTHEIADHLADQDVEMHDVGPPKPPPPPSPPRASETPRRPVQIEPVTTQSAASAIRTPAATTRMALAERPHQEPPVAPRSEERPKATSSPPPAARPFHVPLQKAATVRQVAPHDEPSTAADHHSEKEREIVEEIQETARRITDALVSNVVMDARLLKKETRGVTHSLFNKVQEGLDEIREHSAAAYGRIASTTKGVSQVHENLKDITKPRQTWAEAEEMMERLKTREGERGRGLPLTLFG